MLNKNGAYRPIYVNYMNLAKYGLLPFPFPLLFLIEVIATSVGFGTVAT